MRARASLRGPVGAVRRPTGRRVVPVALASVVACGVAASSAGAAFVGLGSPITTHSRTPEGGVPADWGCRAAMSVSTRGDIVGAISGGDGTFAEVRSADRSGGGTTLYQGDRPDGTCADVSTAVGPDGRFVAAGFAGTAGTPAPLQARVGTVDGAGASPDVAATDDPANPGSVVTAMTRGGTAIVVARRADGRLVASTDADLGPGAGQVEVGGDVGTRGRLLALTEDDYGAVTAVWTIAGTPTGGGDPLPFRVASATRGAAGYWSAPVISDPVRAGTTDPAAVASVDRYGSVSVAYAAPGAPTDGVATTDEAGVVERAGDGARWETPQRVAGRVAGREIEPAASVLGTEGRPLTVFDVRRPGDGGRIAVVEAASADAQGRWGSLQPVSGERPVATNPGARASAIFNAAQGVVTVAWTSSQGAVGENDVKARDFQPWDGAWSQVFTVPETALAPTTATRVLLGVDDHADTVLGIPTPGGTGGGYQGLEVLLRYVADDVGGPRMEPIDGPSSVGTGTAARFSVDMRDLFSDIGRTVWDFGDGTTTTADYGETVEHRWTTAGTRTVSATGYDSLGNASTITTTVRVGAASARTAAGTRAVTRAASTARGRVTVSRGTVGARRLTFGVSRAAKLSVALQRRTRKTVRRGGTTRRVTSWVPAGVVAVDAGGAGTVRARVRSLRAGTAYRAVVRARPGSDTTLRTTTLRLRRAR